MEIYFMGTSGIECPKGFDGNNIDIGDKLTFDYLDPCFKDDDMTSYVDKPVYIVKEDSGGDGLYGEGIYEDLYLHDFRFKYCRVIRGFEK